MNKKDYTLIEQNIWKHNTSPKYIVDVYLGRDADGKQQRTTKTCYSLSDARKTLTLTKADKIKGTGKTKSKAPSIYELMKDYREVYVERKTEKTTAYGYGVIERHITNFFNTTGKNTRLDKITSSTVDQYFTYLANIRTKRSPNGIGANTIIKHFNYLNQLFDYAVKHQDTYGILVNPVKNATKPKRKKPNTPDLTPYNMDMIFKLIDVVMETKDLAFESAVLIALLAGARRGEAEYLKWKDLDLDLGLVEITGSRTASNVEVIRDSPKNGYSRETSLCDILVDTLREYKQWQLRNKELLGSEYQDSDYVLSKANGEPYSIKWINMRFSKFLKKNGFPHIRFHDLRHLNASILLRLDIPLTDVSKHLGHTTPNTTTRIYAHSLMNKRNTIAIGLNGLFQTQKKDKQEPVL